VSYWDSSALVKLYTQEADSEIFEEAAANAETRIVISRLGIYEIATTLHRKESEGTIAHGSARTAHERLLKHATEGEVQIIEFSSDVEQKFHEVIRRCFGNVPSICVKTLDAIHLGSALAGEESEVVATDKRLREAAAFLGLTVFP
jgi:uncharacterized protein with PIN domain